MANGNEQHLTKYRTRAALPNVLRYIVLAFLAVAMIALVVAFYRGRTTNGFKVRSEHARLSAEVVANVDNYERLETSDGIPKLYVKAANAVTYSDGHQEFTSAYVRLYDEAGNESEEMTAGRALYIPEADKNFTVYLKESVSINGRDGITIKTDNLVYNKLQHSAESEDAVEFTQGGISGKAVGTVIDMTNKKLELQRDVEVTNIADDGQRARVTAGTATYDHGIRRIDLRDNVKISVTTPNTDVTDATGSLVSVFLNETAKPDEKPSVKMLEMNDNVNIRTNRGGRATTVTAAYAQYTIADERAELKGSANIISDNTTLKAEHIVYEPAMLRATLTTAVEATQNGDKAAGDVMSVSLYDDRSVKHVTITGNAIVQNSAPDRSTTVRAPRIDADWKTGQVLTAANTTGETTVNIVPTGNSKDAPMSAKAARAANVTFIGNGAIGQIVTDGRTSIRIDGDKAATDGASKTVTADTIKTDFHADGKSIKRAEAVGNAELYVEPLKGGENVYKTRVNAPRFDCDFYATGNAARSCVGQTKTRTVREPMFQSSSNGQQTITGDKLNATFTESPNELSTLVVAGNGKFTELDRNVTASTIAFTTATGVIALRGGEPTAWDNSSRAKAKEIDWDSKAKRSYLRGKVSTTYYSKRTAGEAVPFSDSGKPVFVTSDAAEFDHTSEVAVFTGNARGWQDDNYVRADKLTILQREGRFLGDGNVQSTVYDAKQTMNGRDSKVPVFVTSGSLDYNRTDRIIKYRTNVDIRQGSDRLTSASADVFMDDRNELVKTITETNVVVTQPGRRATGDWLQYTAANEVAILRGSPARVTDSENGAIQGTEVTVYMKEKHFIGNGKTPKNPNGRIRTVYKTDPTQ